MSQPQQFRFQELLRRMFDIKGPGGGSVIDDVMPVFPLDYPDKSEQYRQREERFFEGALTQLAVLAQVPQWFIQAAPGQLTTLEELIIQSSTAQTIEIGISLGVSNGAVMTPLSLSVDARDLPKRSWALFAETTNRRAVRTGTTTTGVAFGGNQTLKRFAIAANVPQLIRVRYILWNPSGIDGEPEPGSYSAYFVFVQGRTANTDLTVSHRGYERAPAKVELSGW